MHERSLRASTERGRALVAALACALACLVVQIPPTHAREGLPARLTDEEFRSLITDLSEPEGRFSSDNLVSNEDTFQIVVPELQRRGLFRSEYSGSTLRDHLGVARPA